MTTLILMTFVVLIIAIAIVYQYYFTITKQIMNRYDKAPYVLVLFYNPSYHIIFYGDHKSDLTPKEANAFKCYFSIYTVMIILFITLFLIGNTLIYLNTT